MACLETRRKGRWSGFYLPWGRNRAAANENSSIPRKERGEGDLRFLRFQEKGLPSWGIVEEDLVERISWKDREGGLFKRAGEYYPIADLKLLPPCNPSKIIGIGLNYRSHAEELHLPLPEAPILFMKPSTAVIGPREAIVLPPQSRRVDYEAELGVVIGTATHRVAVEEARKHIWGYTCANDVTARDLQPKDGQWTLSKGFDSFAPLGPWIETEVQDPAALQVQGLLNGQVVQQGSIDDLVFSIEELIAYISACMTLLPGDVIFTGTPAGIGPLREGDQFTVRIGEIGELTNRVALLP